MDLLDNNTSSLETNFVNLNANESDIHLQMVSIFWNPLQLPLNVTYNLTVTSSSTQPQSFQVHASCFVFTAPEGAPPCEVYNFSVTATYVGATYTGVGCRVPSPVLSKMLPSLPNITTLEYSLNYSLEKQSSGTVNLRLFMVSNLFKHTGPSVFCSFAHRAG